MAQNVQCMYYNGTNYEEIYFKTLSNLINGEINADTLQNKTYEEISNEINLNVENNIEQKISEIKQMNVYTTFTNSLTNLKINNIIVMGCILQVPFNPSVVFMIKNNTNSLSWIQGFFIKNTNFNYYYGIIPSDTNLIPITLYCLFEEKQITFYGDNNGYLAMQDKIYWLMLG